ncbi:MAG: glycosyltransferase family 4 protein [Candidatus Kerfeldbacteria bacterium]|nr:glycosyltransferase family 4 protein [Candidatus Kerfeldbacteria bacterium]
MTRVLIFKFPFSSNYGGGEHHTITLVRELRNRGMQFHFVGSCRVLLREFQKRGWSATRRWAGVEPVSIWSLALFPLTAIPVWFVLVATLVRMRVAGVRVLYCLSLTEKLLVPIPARLIGMRIVWVEHVAFDRWLTRNPFRFLYTLQSRFATVVCPSRSLADDAVRLGVPRTRVRVIPHGIDTAQFTVRAARTDHRHFTVGCVARLEPEKGVEYLLMALRLVRDIVPTARLVVVGDGSLRASLQQMVRTTDLDQTVQFVGFQRAIHRWYQTFDCFVLPSIRRESFGIVLLESLASGVPVITTSIGGTTEIIRHETNGLVVPPRNAGALADAIIRLAQHPPEAEAFAVRGRAIVEAEYSEERMIQAWIVLLTGGPVSTLTLPDVA